MSGTFRLEHEHFEFEAPGEWVAERAPAPNVLYCGRRSDGRRRMTVSGFRFKAGLTEEQRLNGAERILSTLVQSDQEVSGDKAKIIRSGPTASDGVIHGDYAVIHPAGGRVVYSRLIMGGAKAINFYWEVVGLTALPDIAALHREFLEVAKTFAIYEGD